jgi:hypothetical protein
LGKGRLARAKLVKTVLPNYCDSLACRSAKRAMVVNFFNQAITRFEPQSGILSEIGIFQQLSAVGR